MKSGIKIEPCQRIYEEGAVVESWLHIRNDGEAPAAVPRTDSLVLELPQGDYELIYYTSSWGNEFQPIRHKLTEEVHLCNQTGRSSQGMHPWFTLIGPDARIMTGTIMWSGNWAIHFEPHANGLCVRAGIDESLLQKTLMPGEAMETPHVAVAYAASGDLNDTSVLLARVGRAHWIPACGATDSLAVEWNHWWVYEDKIIDETVFRQNVDIASELGFELCTLDAGWFGPSDAEVSWFDVRGDWDLVNEARFPSGIRALSDYTHAKGMKFGLWCEIEALGQKAHLAIEQPDFSALRDGNPIGYVCFGNPAVQEWAFHVLDRLITDYRCDWVKLDFNLDPMAGCNRVDHGHGAGDGLYEHYVGYYNVLDKIRAKHPDVVLENCASGGLRIDLGMLRHTHTTFLSDPDWPDHNLQVFWGATTMLPAHACLHWANSEWYGENPNQVFHPDDPNVTDYELDLYVRSAMLGGLGFSQRLPDLPQWIRERYKAHVVTYQQLVRPFVREADVYRLTDQPRRDGVGTRWAAFQYDLRTVQAHLLFVFRLTGAEQTRRIKMKNLKPEIMYRLSWDAIGCAGREARCSGEQLMRDGLLFDELREMESALLHITEIDCHA